MPLPPLLLGVVILIWGWCTGLLLAAVPLALVLESARWMRRRWEFSHSDYQKIWNGCLVLLLASVVFAVGYSRSLLENGVNMQNAEEGRENASQAARSALLFFQWLPLVFAPVAVAVSLGGHWLLPSVIFSWFARRHRSALQVPFVERFCTPVAPVSAYLALAFFSIATCNLRHPSFFVILVALGAWALWPFRSRRSSRLVWALLLLLTGGLGFAGSHGVLQLQKYVANLDNFITQRFTRSHANPFEARTMIGSLGRIKASGRIVLQLTTTNDSPAELLRQASYDSFLFSAWMVGARNDRSRTNTPWRTVVDESTLGTWTLMRSAKPRIGTVRLTHFTQGGATLLPLPNGSVSLDDLRAGQVSRSGFGCVRAGDLQGLLDYQVTYCSGSTLDDPPTERDRFIPVEERAAVNQVAETLHLANYRAEADKVALAVVSEYFARNFKYSTYLTAAPETGTNRSHVSEFLLNQRSGHCEYFATATCLLLRAVGIPTRYALGYLVTEQAGHGKYLVRDRHAHAWCLVWSAQDQCWHDFDTTPSSWIETESARSTAWEPIGDIGARLWLELVQWREGRSELSRYAIYGLSTVLVIFFLRLFLKTHRKGVIKSDRDSGPHFEPLGMSSEYYQVEKALARKRLARRPDETQRQWLERVVISDEPASSELVQLVELHYRLRFDPEGLPSDDRRQLRDQAVRCVAVLSQNQTHKRSSVVRTAAKS